MTKANPRALLSLAALGATALMSAAALRPAIAATSADQARPDDSIAAVRSATARYHDVQVAIADGYVPSDHCVASPAGVMGYHYTKPSLLAQPPDLRRPAMLLYLPTEKGLELGGVEWIQADGDQDPATDADRPSLLGVPFNGPMPGHEPGQPVHYDLHAWVWQHNPAGTFAQFNPAASC